MGRKVILSIGIGDIREPPILLNPKHEAKALWQTLCDLYDYERNDKYLLPEKNVTRSNVLNILASFEPQDSSNEKVEVFDTLDPNDHLVIFISGHGGYDDEKKDAYFKTRKVVSETDNKIYFSEVAKHLEQIQAQNVLLIVDTCYSGGAVFTPETELGEEALSRLRQPYNLSTRTIISSGGMELVEASGFEEKRSRFCTYLLKALKEPADNKISVNDIYDFISVGLGRNIEQQPQIGELYGSRSEAGSFYFEKSSFEPFCGLSAMTGEWSDRFFGRDQEIQEVIERLKTVPILAIAADSGAGKSSLAMAGVAPAWKHGQSIEDSKNIDSGINQQVLIFRPRTDPLSSLKDAVEDLAKVMGRSLADQRELRNMISSSIPDDVYAALRCGSSAQSTNTLLIIDQAEELFTQTQDKKRRDDFFGLLASLAAEAEEKKKLRILLTIRSDYANLLSEAGELKKFFSGANTIRSFFRLKAPSDTNLSEMIEKPLKLAGLEDQSQIDELSKRIIRDLPKHDGDLALAQFALSETWKNRGSSNQLLVAYDSLNGVLGALGTKAENYILNNIAPEQQNRIIPIFVRLINLGDSALRPTRRTADLSSGRDSRCP